jgi:hypothetical protein
MSASSALSLERPRKASPVPYQPGSIARACAQLNTHGIARRSSIALDLVRLDGRDPIFSVAISAIGVIARKKSLNAGGLVDQPAIGGERAGRQLHPSPR